MKHTAKRPEIAISIRCAPQRRVSCRAKSPATSRGRQGVLQTLVPVHRTFLMVVPAHKHAQYGFMTVSNYARMSDRLPFFPLMTLSTA